MMTKSELARKAGVSALTVDRIESGRPCRLTTKRNILAALGLGVEDRERVFGTASPYTQSISEPMDIEVPLLWKTGGGVK